MLRVAVAVLLAGISGCGRLGFDLDVARDGRERDSIGDDGQILIDAAPIDTPVGMVCATDSECGRCARCDGVCAVEPVTELFLGHRSTCYIGAGGTRWCAGDNSGGQLGLGDTTGRPTPTRIADGDQWERINLFYYGRAHATRLGQFYEWGNGTLLPIATGASRSVRAVLGDLNRECFWELDNTASTCPGAGATVWHSLDYGADHFCGIRTDRTLWCWGTNYSDAVGVNTAEGANIAAPTQVGTDTDWDQVGTGGRSAGVNFTGSTCARKTTGQIYCWGHPSLTGTNGVDVGPTPTLITPATDWMWIDVDWQHACAGKTNGTVWCWGADTYGGFVAPGLTSAAVPTKLPDTYDRWIMGGHHACGLSGGRWRCFGWNEDGQLGVGNTTNTGELVNLCP